MEYNKKARKHEQLLLNLCLSSFGLGIFTFICGLGYSPLKWVGVALLLTSWGLLEAKNSYRDENIRSIDYTEEELSFLSKVSKSVESKNYEIKAFDSLTGNYTVVLDIDPQFLIAVKGTTKPSNYRYDDPIDYDVIMYNKSTEKVFRLNGQISSRVLSDIRYYASKVEFPNQIEQNKKEFNTEFKDFLEDDKEVSKFLNKLNNNTQE